MAPNDADPIRVFLAARRHHPHTDQSLHRVQGADSPQPRADAVLSEIGNPLVDLLPIPDREKLALSSRTTASGPPSRREEEDIDLNAHVDLNVRGLGHLQDAGNPLVPILGFTAPSSTAHVAASLPTTTSATRPRHKSARARDDSALNYPGNPLPAVLCRLFGACVFPCKLCSRLRTQISL